MIYFVVFCSAIYALHQAEKHENINWCRNTWLIISITIPTLLAALRDLTIGTDIYTYMLPAYRLAKGNGLYAFLLQSKEEILYDLTVFFVTKMSGNFQMVLGVTQLFVMIPIYIVIWHQRKKISVVYSSAVFYFVFYCNSYNTIRQNIAMSFLLLATYFLQTKRKWYCVAGFIAAFGFHKSAVVGIVIFLIYGLLTNHFKKWLYYPIVAAVIVAVMLYDRLILFIYRFMPFLPQRYISERFLYREANWPITDTVLMTVVFFISLALVFLKKDKDYFLAMMGFIAFCGLWMGNVSAAMDRLFWYFKIFIILILPQGVLFFKKNQANRVLYGCLLGLFLSGYWVLYFGMLGNAEVYPYKFFGN